MGRVCPRWVAPEGHCAVGWVVTTPSTRWSLESRSRHGPAGMSCEALNLGAVRDIKAS